MGQDAYALIAQDAETLGRRIAELSQMVSARQSAKGDHNSMEQATFSDPDVVVVLDGARRLRSMPGVPTLLKDGPDVGVFAALIVATAPILRAKSSFSSVRSMAMTFAPIALAIMMVERPTPPQP